MKDKNKENRLKAALRENLKRRKTQTRNRFQTPVPNNPDDAPEGLPKLQSSETSLEKENGDL